MPTSLARSLSGLLCLCCFWVADGMSEAGEIVGWNALYLYMLGVRFNFTLQTIESDSKQWLSVSACVCMRECYKEEKPMLSVIVITLWLDKIVSVTTVCVVCISNCELRARLCVCVCVCVVGSSWLLCSSIHMHSAYSITTIVIFMDSWISGDGKHFISNRKTISRYL